MPALRLLIILTLITGIAYPLLTTGLARIIFRPQAEGSLVVRDNKRVGSALIGQQFSQLHYFWSRPSATQPLPYDALASGGSNLALSNPILAHTLSQRVQKLQQAHSAVAAIPVDLVTASASGLDPHISPAAAHYQAARVAAARQIPLSTVEQLIGYHTQQAGITFLAEPVVNVLALNMALDKHTTLQP